MNIIKKNNYLTNNYKNAYPCKLASISAKPNVIHVKKKSTPVNNTQLKWGVLFFSHVVYGFMHTG
jgi:hypothetical protein